MAEGKERYAIVRVDNSCPAMLDDFGCIIARNMLHCKCGEDTKNYGDTKEQLEKKIITAIERAGIDYVQLSKEEIAKEIVEFLGVK